MTPHEWIGYYTEQLYARAHDGDLWAISELASLARLLASLLPADEVLAVQQSSTDYSKFFKEEA